ncbi:sensor histidine kinase [Sphingomonas sp. PB4P5]|uniref:sensor histidine kinase n=1 Tax=Parasphingomonas puruogangriensis TaxID=3096155 RepID=UPI002FC732EF
MTTPLPTRDDGVMQTKTERWWDGPWPWLVYLAFYAMPWLWRPPTHVQLIASVIGIAVFLPTYFISHRLNGMRLLGTIAAIFAIGAMLAPFGGSWTVFSIYAGSEAGRMRPARHAIIGLAVLVLATAAVGFAWGQPLLWWLPGVLLLVMTGGATISREAFYARTQALLATQEEVRRLAGTAERERITRDLHDVVGRTLTLVALKADLAGKLVVADATSAQAECRAIALLAREGLGDVRAALAGQAGGSLAHEAAASSAALAAASVSPHITGDFAAIPSGAGAVLAMTLREAVTNVIRHAEAQRCTIDLAMTGQEARLAVCDDGHGRSFTEGRGLTGMRQRLQAAGGSLTIDPGTGGMRLIATVPA